METENVKDTEEVNGETPEVEVESTEPETEGSPETLESEEPKPRIGDVEYTNSVKRRIDKITREKYEAQKRADELERKVKEYESRIGDRPSRPNISNYTNDMGELDPISYDKAMAEYEDSLFDWREHKTKASNSEYTKKAEQEVKTENFNILSDVARTKYSDYDTIVEKPVFGESLRDAIIESENGAELAYFLGNNEKEAFRLNDMPTHTMMKEIGKLEERIVRLNKNTSKAPDPITPVNGVSGTSIKKSSSEMTDDEWFAAERKRRIEKLKLKQR